MAKAFRLVNGATCVMRGNGKEFHVREGMIGEVKGELYADVGPVFLKLSRKECGAYEDHQGRMWDVFTPTPLLQKLPVAFEVLDGRKGTYITRSEDEARRSGFQYNGLYRREGYEQLTIAPTARDALRAISGLPTPDELARMDGHEEAYRVVERLFERTPPPRLMTATTETNGHE